jgi:hypothetical protein
MPIRRSLLRLRRGLKRLPSLLREIRTMMIRSEMSCLGEMAAEMVRAVVSPLSSKEASVSGLAWG